MDTSWLLLPLQLCLLHTALQLVKETYPQNFFCLFVLCNCALQVIYWLLLYKVLFQSVTIFLCSFKKSSILRSSILKSSILKSSILKSSILKSSILKPSILKSSILKSSILNSFKKSYFNALNISSTKFWLWMHILEGKLGRGHLRPIELGRKLAHHQKFENLNW